MAEPLKNIYDKSYVRRLAEELLKAGVELDLKDFEAFVFDEAWGDLELKGRTTQLCHALHHFLPDDFDQACEILIRAGESFGGYEGMFFPEYVMRFGLEDRRVSLKTLEVLTTYSSAEFAIRPFLQSDPVQGIEQMKKWAHHKNYHVRRLASEGARPLLPWASHLTLFREKPEPLFEILDQLINDESLYVRKSVANHLNDISKDHPKLALLKAKEWLKKSKSTHTQWIVKHGLRTLLKKGDQKALKLFGYARKNEFMVSEFFVTQKLVTMNETLDFSFKVDVKKKGHYRFEYALHFLKANGHYTRKVFKLSEKELSNGEHDLDKKHLFKLIGTRKYHDGLHFIELIVNGHSIKKEPFVLWHEKPAYLVYMILTERGTIYSGITTDINRRFEEHRSGKKGAKYTKANSPKYLIYLESATDRSDASKRESFFKKLNRKKKEELSWMKVLNEEEI